METSVLYLKTKGLLLVVLFVCGCAANIPSSVGLNETRVQQARNDSNLSNRECFDGKRYSSLFLCRNGCKDGRQIVGNNIPNITKLFKLIMLQVNEHNITNDGHLLTNLPRSTFTSDFYSISSDGARAYLCYPMTKEFNECTKWSISSENFEYDAKSRILHVPRIKSYAVDEFFMYKIGHKARTCVIRKASSIRRTVQLCTVAISAAMLLITIGLAVWIPALNIKQNFVLMSHLVMLAAAYFVMMIKLIVDRRNVGAACIYLPLLQQYFFLSAFFWINLQAFDLCRKLTKIKARPDAPSSLKIKKWITYSCYACLVPLIITMVTLATELSLSTKSVFHPALRDYCWFQNNKLVPFLYFYAPISLILVANLILFIITVISLFKVGRGVVSANKKIHQQLFVLYLKLVLVMGLCWTMEIASWAEGDSSPWWAITDTINSLQGLFIFIVYICKRSQIKTIFHHLKSLTSKLSKLTSSQEDGSSLTKNENISSTETKSGSNEVQSTAV